jgi:predicted O-methyltransferase YrrM
MTFLGGCYYHFCATRFGHRLARAFVHATRRNGRRRSFHMPFDALESEHEAVAALMRLWRRVHWSCGDGMMPAEQLLEVYRLAVGWPVDGDTVELGAWVGLTTSYLATACRVRGRGHVYAVDTFQGHREGGTFYPSVETHSGSTLAAFRARIARSRVRDLVQPLIGCTTDVAGRYPGRPIRVLLIDADHSYEGVRDDFRAWAPHVAPGGLVIFHDYLMPGVARFIDEDLPRREDFVPSPGRVDPNIMAVTRRFGARAVRGSSPHADARTEGRPSTPAPTAAPLLPAHAAPRAGEHGAEQPIEVGA